MIENRRVIGLFITKLNNRTHADFVNRMHYIARENNFGLAVFNSAEDFYKKDAYSDSAKNIYENINFRIIDAVIIPTDHFYDKEIVLNIVNQAKKHNIPVVVTDMEIDGCYSIVKDYEESYKTIIRHVIKDHGVTDTFFMAGIKGDGISEHRIKCYKDVLEENGLEFSEDRVGYGEYWHYPTHVVVNKLIENGKKPPRAVICANDFMAIAVCEKLADEGYKIPEDVIVTGFDGVPDADYFNPRLTTCREDIEQLVKLSVELVHKALDENLPCGVFKENYIPSIACSCGCSGTADSSNHDASYIFHVMQEMENHENFMYTHLNKMIESYDMKQLIEIMSKCILPNSYLCLKSDFAVSAELLPSDMGVEIIDGYAVIPAKDNRSKRIGDIAVLSNAGIMPDARSWAYDNSAYILSPIYADNEIYGCYASKAYELFTCAHQINRINRIINIAVNSAASHSKQLLMEQSIERASMINSLTELPNLKGAAKWFDDFASKPENHKKMLAVSVYNLPKYRYIYENYGIKDIEEAITVVANNLRTANPEKCLLAHIADDEFIIVNYIDVEAGENVSDVINNATSSFFGNMGQFNDANVKEYYVETNCGCTVANPGWDETLANLIRFARGEMYMNRIKNGIGDAVKSNRSEKENYDAFNVLVEKNLFSYHFQPIVNAKNGEIYGYEALMRTDSSIGMNPLEVLETAGAYKRLYDIEKATMFNVMERFSSNFDKFGNHKVFINSIPGYFLNESDNKLLSERYSDYIEYCVFEITELNSISDDELKNIRYVGGGSENQIAIDDYGTGHSNIVNLLRYAPQIVKIDRFLITDIHRDVNKQMFVKSTIEFARLNGIKVLAEGVETSDEMRTVIDFGVDYIQGYYTGRPAPEPVAEINEEIKAEILNANPLFVNQHN